MNDNKIKYGTREWYLYHHVKNEEPVIPLILISCFLFICKGGIFNVIVVWIWYATWAHKNNDMLNNDPEVLRERESYKKYKRKNGI